jgi:hypothetical protein
MNETRQKPHEINKFAHNINAISNDPSLPPNSNIFVALVKILCDDDRLLAYGVANVENVVVPS